MGFFSDLLSAFVSALSQVGGAFVSSLPNIVVAIVFIIIGYVLGCIVKYLVVRLLKSAHFDEWMQEQNLTDSIGNKKISTLGGSIAKWYIFFVFLKQAVELVKLSTINEVLGFWINFALLLIAAMVVILAGLIVGRYVRNIIESSRNSLRKVGGLVIELTLVYVAVVMAIRIVGLPTEMLEAAFLISFTGFILALSLIFGISFGLALKDEAKIIVKEIRRRH
jgi:hypothetical protein